MILIVLLQEDTKGVDHHIGYFSHKLNTSQKNYSTSEKEVLALVMALQHLDFYLTPAQFPMKTDHNSLVFNKEQESMSVALKLITAVI